MMSLEDFFDTHQKKLLEEEFPKPSQVPRFIPSEVPSLTPSQVPSVIPSSFEIVCLTLTMNHDSIVSCLLLFSIYNNR